jgi:hypothetical protein
MQTRNTGGQGRETHPTLPVKTTDTTQIPNSLTPDTCIPTPDTCITSTTRCVELGITEGKGKFPNTRSISSAVRVELGIVVKNAVG